MRPASMLVRSLLLIVLIAPMPGPSASADPGGPANPQVVPFSPRYAKLSARWWEWALGQPVTPNDPETTNPLFDTTGVAAHNGQPDDVFFLAGLLSINSGLTAQAERTITVAKGTHFFLPILNFEQDNVGVNPPLSVADLRKSAAMEAAQVSSLFASIDGVEIQDLQAYRTISPVFTYTLPKDNPAADRFNVYSYLSGGAVSASGPQKPGVGDGFYLLLKPLHPGRHTIRFGGTTQVTGPDGSPATFSLDITYHVIVKAH